MGCRFDYKCHLVCLENPRSSLGRGKYLPGYIVENRGIIPLDRDIRRGKPYEDHLCFFRCLALHNGWHTKNLERHTVPLPTVPRSWVMKKEVSWCQDKWTGRTGKIISQCTSVYSRANTNPQWRRRRSRKYSRDCRYTDPPLTSPLLQHAVPQRLREPFRILKISPGTRSPFVVLVMVNTGKICGNVSVTRRHVTEKSSWNILAVRTMSQKQCLKN